MSDLVSELRSAEWKEVSAGNPPAGKLCLFWIGNIAFRGRLSSNDEHWKGITWWPIDFRDHATTEDYAIRAMWAEIPESAR